MRLVGLADIVLGVTAPTNDLHARLQRLPVVVPGTVAALTRTADIIIGLMLLMLSHGLRRRKHRAWQEVMALLMISALIGLAHATYLVRHHRDMAFRRRYRLRGARAAHRRWCVLSAASSMPSAIRAPAGGRSPS